MCCGCHLDAPPPNALAVCVERCIAVASENWRNHIQACCLNGAVDNQSAPVNLWQEATPGPSGDMSHHARDRSVATTSSVVSGSWSVCELNGLSWVTLSRNQPELDYTKTPSSGRSVVCVELQGDLRPSSPRASARTTDNRRHEVDSTTATRETHTGTQKIV